jgi:hypothetical protein
MSCENTNKDLASTSTQPCMNQDYQDYQEEIELNVTLDKFNTWLQSIISIKQGHKLEDLGYVFICAENDIISNLIQSCTRTESGRDHVLVMQNKYHEIDRVIAEQMARISKKNFAFTSITRINVMYANLSVFVRESAKGVEKFMSHPKYEKDLAITSPANNIIKCSIPGIMSRINDFLNKI